MTLEEYDALKAFQGGLCYLCRRANGSTKALAVDHDHVIARDLCGHPEDESCKQCWRGLLCSMCNKINGHARDDATFFERGRSYLLDPPARFFFRNMRDESEVA